MRLIGNLFCYIWTGKGNNSNSYLFANVLRGDRPHVIIDPGQVVNELREPCFDRLLRFIERDGLKAEDIGLIINTHSHPDHCDANEALVELTKKKTGTGNVKQALIAIHRDEVEHQRMMRELMAKMLGRETRFEPDFFLREGNLNLGKENKVNLEILHTPGHSPGSISIYWPEHRVLITGDVLFYRAVGRTDFPSGDGKLLKRSIEKLAELDVEYLLPGHNTEFGSIIRGKEKVKENFNFVRRNYFPIL